MVFYQNDNVKVSNHRAYNDTQMVKSTLSCNLPVWCLLFNITLSLSFCSRSATFKAGLYLFGLTYVCCLYGTCGTGRHH